jgi:hypothetical protein
MIRTTVSAGEPWKLRIRSALAVGSVALTVGAAVLLSLYSASVAEAARLAKPKEAKALRAAFEHEKGHKGALITAITVSTAMKGYAAVAYLPGPSQARAARPKVINLRQIYSEQPHKPPKPVAKPPKKAKDDLAKDLWITITYEGSGSEHLHEQANDPGVCQSDITTESVDVKPYGWRYVYQVDLDKTIDYTESKDGYSAVDPLVRVLSPPNDVSGAISQHWTEATTTDGLDGCSNTSTDSAATSAFQGLPKVLPGVISFSDRGLEILTPFVISSCDPSGPHNLCVQPITTAFALKGASVAVGQLGFATLPANTDTPIAVTEADSLANVTPEVCAGTTSCNDTFNWSGTVTVSP